jgi:hypothetical protein
MLKETKIRIILYFLIMSEIIILTLTLFATYLVLFFDTKKAHDTAWWYAIQQGPVHWQLKDHLPLFNAVLCKIEDCESGLVQFFFPA